MIYIVVKYLRRPPLHNIDIRFPFKYIVTKKKKGKSDFKLTTTLRVYEIDNLPVDGDII